MSLMMCKIQYCILKAPNNFNNCYQNIQLQSSNNYIDGWLAKTFGLDTLNICIIRA